jgi:hypothetical protein
VQLNFLWRYEIPKFLIFSSEIMQEFETLALKNLYLLQKIGYFRILNFELKLDISSTLAYNVSWCLVEKKKVEQG